MGEFVLGMFCGAILTVVVLALCRVADSHIDDEDDDEETILFKK